MDNQSKVRITKTEYENQLKTMPPLEQLENEQYIQYFRKFLDKR